MRTGNISRVPSHLPVQESRQHTHTHKVLMCGYDGNTYSWNAVYQLLEHGLLMEHTTLATFARHVDEFIKDYDLFIFTSSNTTINYLHDVTAQQVIESLQKWRNAGKKLIYLTSGWRFNVVKENADGTSEDVSLDAVFPLTKVYSTTMRREHNSRFEKAPGYEDIFGEDEIFTEEHLKPEGSVYTFQDAEGVPLVRAVDDNNTRDIVMFKEGDYCLISWGGWVSGAPEDTPGYRYINLGVVARRLLGLSSAMPKLALDCKYSRKVAASGCDCDVTNEPNAIMPYVEAYKHRPFEFGVVGFKVTDQMIDFYRHLGHEITSHGYWHHMNNTMQNTSQVVTVPQRLYVRLDKPYRVTLDYVRFTSDNSELSSSEGILASGEYHFDKRGYIRFSPDDVGREIEIGYTHSLEPEEWIGGVLDLEDKKIITNKSVYLTGEETSVHPVTMLWLERWGYTVCDHVNPPRRAFYLLESGQKGIKTLIPWLSPTFDSQVYGYGHEHSFRIPEEEAKSIHVPAMIAFCKQRNLPYLWYNHDFLFAKEYHVRIFENPDGGFHDDWSAGLTYEEVVEKVKGMIEYTLDALDEVNAYWMVRSDYCRWFKNIVQGIQYSVESVTDSTIEMLVTNNGPKHLKGLTFRLGSSVKPDNIKVSGNDIDFQFDNGETLFDFDIAPGQTLTVNIEK